MSLPPDNLGYPIDTETWRRTVNPLEEENQKEGILNGYITRVIQGWSNQRINDIALWEDFRDEFEGWTPDIFKLASRGALKVLRIYLTTHGVWVKTASGTSFAKVLHDCLEEDTRHEWTKEEIEQHLRMHPGNFNSRWNPGSSQSQTAYQMPSTPQISQATAVQPSTVNLQLTQDQPISQPRSTTDASTTFDQASTHSHQQPQPASSQPHINAPAQRIYGAYIASFANNKDFSSQIGHEIILANETTQNEEFGLIGNLIHWSLTKSKSVTESVLASEIYGMVGGVDMAIAIGTTIKMTTDQLGLPKIPTIVCTDSYSLYECLVKPEQGSREVYHYEPPASACGRMGEEKRAGIG
jgi:hypothetical protein